MLAAGRRPLAAGALLLLLALAPAAEPLVCRGFPAATAADAIAGQQGRLVILDGADDRQRPVWFAAPGGDPATAAQALAHALGCWWSTAPDGSLRLGLAPRLAPGHQEAHAYSGTLVGRPAAEAIALRLMDPWLGGAGGLVLDAGTGRWAATLDEAGDAQATALFTALATQQAQAPNLLPGPGEPATDLALDRSPVGADLAAWCIDLTRAGGIGVALGTGVDPARAAPAGTITTLAAAVAALAGSGLEARVFHRCLCVGPAPADRQHPAQRRELAVVPLAHLCRGDAELERFATLLAARVLPTAWRLPGWGLVPLPWTRSLLIAGDPPAIHAALAAIEAADAVGLEAWGEVSPPPDAPSRP